MGKTAAQTNSESMGTFYTSCRIENIANRSQSAVINKLLVDTGSEYTWMPAMILNEIGVKQEKQETFVMASGQQVIRNIGFATDFSRSMKLSSLKAATSSFLEREVLRV
jgi:hypothetical protein